MVWVLMIDLLVERETFGLGANQEVVRPFAARGDVELLLVTPQMQSFEAGKKPNQEKCYFLKKMFLTGMMISLSGNQPPLN